MTASNSSPNALGAAASSETTWQTIWATVPDEWSEGVYRLDQVPHNEVFVRNTKYLRSTKAQDFKPRHARMGQELSWWVWTVWAEGTRKIDPAMLRWWQRAIDSLATGLIRIGPREASVADFDPGLVTREGLRLFEARNGRLPSPGNIRNLDSVATSIHEHVSIRCSDQPWWASDLWSLALDPRIPRREHEPSADTTINLADVSPDWLREGLRYWLSRALILDLYTWTSLCSRATHLTAYYGRFATEQGIETPAVTNDPDQLRAVFMEFLSWLRSPAATQTGKPLAATGVSASQSMVQRFYEFMADNAREAADFTGDHRWRDLTAAHTRLWAPAYRPRRQGNQRELSYIATSDVHRMLGYLDALAKPTDRAVTIGERDGHPRTVRGLGDPQAARAWLLQALTGRRASEILMLDHDCYTMLPDKEDNADPDEFVARLRYQQTKVDGVDATILIEQAVLNVITEQQDWLRDEHPDVHARGPKYLFINPRGNHRGLRPRSYRSYGDALKRLDTLVDLRDADDQPLRFTQTHRLPHTRATELLNAGVPIHVVQRYLGHRSPEMTMRYAATLAATAEAEFLRYKKVGSDGRDLDISPQDLLDLSQLDRRADRMLPNGLCMLPPTQSCDKGNACLSCGSFATDRSHLPDHAAQRDRTRALIEARQTQFQARFGTPMPEDNIWLTGRRQELAALDSIITRLDSEDADQAGAVAGPGTRSRGAVPVDIVTDGAHAAALSKSLEDRIDP